VLHIPPSASSFIDISSAKIGRMSSDRIKNIFSNISQMKKGSLGIPMK
jgi:hypothetical protein